jgi:hypothetical protein
MNLATNYYALVAIPVSILLIVSLLSYYLGLKYYAAFGLGVVASMISIIILHPFHFDNGRLINETGNLYTSIYIVSSIIIFISIFCFIIFKFPTKKICCEEEQPQDLYKNDIDSIEYNGYNAPKIEHYQDNLLGYTTDESNKVVRYQNSSILEGSPPRRTDQYIDKVKETIVETTTIATVIDDGLLQEPKKSGPHSLVSDSE